MQILVFMEKNKRIRKWDVAFLAICFGDNLLVTNTTKYSVNKVSNASSTNHYLKLSNRSFKNWQKKCTLPFS